VGEQRVERLAQRAGAVDRANRRDPPLERRRRHSGRGAWRRGGFRGRRGGLPRRGDLGLHALAQAVDLRLCALSLGLGVGLRGVRVGLRRLARRFELVLPAAPLGFELELRGTAGGGDGLIHRLLESLFLLLTLSLRGLCRELFRFRARGRGDRVDLAFPLDPGLLELGAGALDFHGDVALRGGAKVRGDRPEAGLRFGLRLLELRRRLAVRVGRGLAARLGDRLVVFLFECGELLIERPAKLGLQIVQGHQSVLSHKPNGDS